MLGSSCGAPSVLAWAAVRPSGVSCAGRYCAGAMVTHTHKAEPECLCCPCPCLPGPSAPATTLTFPQDCPGYVRLHPGFHRPWGVPAGVGWRARPHTPTSSTAEGQVWQRAPQSQGEQGAGSVVQTTWRQWQRWAASAAVCVCSASGILRQCCCWQLAVSMGGTRSWPRGSINRLQTHHHMVWLWLYLCCVRSSTSPLLTARRHTACPRTGGCHWQRLRRRSSAGMLTGERL